MYGCESWTIKKAEHRRIDAFELWCWRRLLRVPWTARRSNLSILKEISPGCSLEGLMLKLKLQYFGHLMQRANSFEKTLMPGKDWGQKGMTEDEMVGWHHRLNGHEFGWTPGAGDGQGGLACCSSWGSKESDTTEWMNWTELTRWQKNGRMRENKLQWRTIKQGIFKNSYRRVVGRNTSPRDICNNTEQLWTNVFHEVSIPGGEEQNNTIK